MALSAGSRVGPFEILAKLGEGGMGEVYRARDTRLGREVALKILPGAFSADSDRVARFEREAKTLAALNHPHIAHLHGIEDAGPSTGSGQAAVRALVMELVEGEDLAQRIARGPVPVDEALPIAKQIADALVAAHEQGIVHRDLKPANIKVRDDGTVKVLDFGLAKTIDPAGGPGDLENSPTITSPALTQAGVILGTAAYMSPEQAKGRSADKRSDVWAFGCVLFEMLTGKRAFAGEDISDTLALILRGEPDWSALPPNLPSQIATMVRRCLVKDRQQRIADMSIVCFLLDAGAGEVSPAMPPASTSARSSSLVWWRVATAVLALTTLVGIGAWYVARSMVAPSAQFVVLPPDGQTFSNSGRPAAYPALSPDGRRLTFGARDATGKVMLWIRPIDSLTAVPLPGTDNGSFPFWSPDSRFIGYFVPGKLMKIDASGSPPQTLCDLSGPTIIGRGGTWSKDGVIVFANGPRPLSRVAASGGPPIALGRPDSVEQFPSFLPDGQHVLFWAAPGGVNGLWVRSLVSGESKRLIDSDSGGVYSPAAQSLMFVRQGTLLAQSFDVRTLSVSNEPFRVAEGVEVEAFPGFVGFSVSEAGVLTYAGKADGAPGLQLMWVDRQGKLIQNVGPPANYRGIDLSPDGRRIAWHRHDGPGGDIWLMEADGSSTRLTFDATLDNSAPVWSPDGQSIIYSSGRVGKWGLFRKSATNQGAEEAVTEAIAPGAVTPNSWTPDGTHLVYELRNFIGGLSRDLWLLPLSGDRQPAALVASPFSESHAQVSPDGKWLAYQASETERDEIHVRPFPSLSGKWQVSNAGGQYVRWRRDGRELFFVSVGSVKKMMSVEVSEDRGGFRAKAPVELFDAGFTNYPHEPLGLGSAYYFPYAVSPDGQRFLIPRPLAPESSTGIVVVTNWLDSLKP